MNKPLAGTGQNSDGIFAAVRLASKPNYLGNIKAVDGLLRELAGQFVIDYGNADTEEEFEAFQKSVPSRCETLANVLLGRAEGYTPLPGWNAPGGIDVFTRDEMPDLTTNTEPLAVMTDAVASFVSDVVHLMKWDAEHDDFDRAAWQNEIDLIVSLWTATFIGVSQKE